MQQIETAKRAADLLFAKAQYGQAVESYQKVVEILKPAIGAAQSEMPLLRTYANCAACYLKLDKHKEAKLMCERAIRIPRGSTEPQLLTKVYHRLALAEEQLEQYEAAVVALDRAIGVELHQAHSRHDEAMAAAAKAGTPAPPAPAALALQAAGADADAAASLPHAAYREKLCQLVLDKRPTFVAMPPPPGYVTKAQVADCVRAMLTSKCDPKDKAMMQALHGLAQTRGFLDVCDDSGNTVLWAACQSAMVRAARLDVVANGQSLGSTSEGANPEQVSVSPDLAIADRAEAAEAASETEEEKALQEAKEARDAEEANPDSVYPVIAMLLGAGANPSQRTARGGKTCLQLLCLAGAAKCVNAFLEMGADPNVRDDEGWGALHVACAPNGPARGKNAMAVKLLLEGGAHANVPNNHGLSPLSLAAQAGCGHSALLLLKAGASINMRCRRGFSPTVWALIGAGGADNSAMQVMMQAAVAHEKVAQEKGKPSFLLQEIEQDRNCYAFSRHVSIVQQVGASDELTAELEAAKVASLCVLTQLGSMNIKADLVKWGLHDAPTGTGNKGEAEAAEDADALVLPAAAAVGFEENPLFAVWKNWEMIYPVICRKPLLPTVTAEQAARNDFMSVITAQLKLDQCWLATVQQALTGPGPAPMLSVVTKGSGDEVWYCRPAVCDDFEAYCVAPLTIQFCSVIPTQLALQAILDLAAPATNSTLVDIKPAGAISAKDEKLLQVCKYWNSVLASMQGQGQESQSETGQKSTLPVFRIYAGSGSDSGADMEEAADAVQVAMASNQSKYAVLLVDDELPPVETAAAGNPLEPAVVMSNGVSRSTISTICELNGLREQQSLLLPSWAHTNPTTLVLLSAAAK